MSKKKAKPLSSKLTPPRDPPSQGRILEWRVHTANLLHEIANSSKQPALLKPLQILGRLLHRVGLRALELDDPELNVLMLRLTIYSQADPEHGDYDPKSIEKEERLCEIRKRRMHKVSKSRGSTCVQYLPKDLTNREFVERLMQASWTLEDAQKEWERIQADEESGA